MDSDLQPIADKVTAGQRLSADDGMIMLKSRDIWTLGELANGVRQGLHGKLAFYNVNQHINYSNVCALSCKFCSFYRKAGQDGAYEFSIDQIVQQANEAASAGATELHIVGGLHPTLPFSYYTDMLRAIRLAAPTLALVRQWILRRYTSHDFGCFHDR